MKQIRKRLTYANVMSSIAVFLILGGATAFAAAKLGKNTVGTKQLKNNAVTTNKIKNGAVTTAKLKDGAVTGAKVNLGSLGKVPSAASADNATNATNAANANTVNGQAISKVSFRTANETGVVGPQTVFSGSGLVITATCTAGQITLNATTSKDNSSIYVDAFEFLETENILQENLQSGQFDVGVTADMLAGGSGNNEISVFEYDAVDGSVVTGTINTDEDGALGGCRATGDVISG